MTIAPRHALVTVSSPEFLTGSRVMIDSFLRHNRWFDGEIVVLHARLTDDQSCAIEQQFAGSRCQRASPPLAAAIDHLCDAAPALIGRRDRFLSLDAFALTDYDTVLFADSDMIFQGDVGDLTDGTGDLLAAPDGAMLRGNRRDADTLEERRGQGAASFNAGLMAIGASVRRGDVFAALLDRLDPARWAAIASDHTDQAVLNLELRDAVTLIGTQYNLMVGHRRTSFAADPVRIADALALHFNGPAKPWLIDRHDAALTHDPGYLGACSRWYDAYFAMQRDTVTTARLAQ